MDHITFYRLYSSSYDIDVKCPKCYEIVISKDSVGDIELIRHRCYINTDIINTFLYSMIKERYSDFDLEKLDFL